MEIEILAYCPVCNKTRHPMKIAYMPKEVVLMCPEGHYQTFAWASNNYQNQKETKEQPVYGKPSYCPQCHQQQFPEDCCVCDGKNPELKDRLDKDKAELLEAFRPKKKGGDA